MPVYSDSGNEFVAGQVPRGATRILDIGCGSGDTAALIKSRNPGIWVEGITTNPVEAAAAEHVMDQVHIFDVEQEIPSGLAEDFDCMLFSHIVEHLREPAAVIQRFLPHLVPGGAVVIAVPNVLEWRTRFRFIRGSFAYAETGILDRTHLRFFTFDSVDGELLGGGLRGELELVAKRGDGSVPLGPLRRLSFLRGAARAIDRAGVASRPNLFAQQVALVARKKGGIAHHPS